jgi:Tfp pilus assembly protein PilF
VRASRSPSPPLEPGVVREHLAVVISSPPFARSNRLQRFLEFVVECELAGRRRDIQEYTIGLEVFDRGESFDPRSDSIVRVEARRLRKRLKQFYAGDGRRQPIRIVLPQRGYVPSFERRRVRPVWAVPAVAGLAAAAAIGAIGYLLLTESGVRPASTPSPVAREAFEKGRTAFRQWTAEGARQAEALFQEAIAHDPHYAQAYAWLSAAYRQQAVMGDASFHEVYAQSSEAAWKAVSLDPERADAHFMLAIILTFEPQWREAERAFQSAIQIEPDNANTHHTYGIMLLAASAARLADAEAELRTAVRLEPGDLANQVVLAKVLYFRGRYSEARVVLEEALRIDPHFPDAMRNLAAVLLQMGEHGEAIRLYKTAQQLSYLPWGDGLLGHALALAGDRPRARALLIDLQSRYTTRPVAAVAIATIQVGLEQWEPACQSLRRAWINRELRTRYIDVDPIYLPLRDRTCFRDLLEDMALAQLAPRH